MPKGYDFPLFVKCLLGTFAMCGEQKKRKSRAASSAINYFNRLDAERKSAGRHMKRTEWLEWRKQTLKDFAALPDDSKDNEAADAVLKHSQRQADQSSGEESGAEYADKSNEATRTVLDAVGKAASPFPAEAFERIVRNVSGQLCGPAPGLSAYSSQLREEQAGRVFFADNGAVPKNEEFEYYLPCPLKHPGLCRTDHANILPQLRSAALAMFDGFRTHPPGTFFEIRFTESQVGPDGALLENSSTWPDYVSSAYSRGANPRMLMLSRVESISGGDGAEQTLVLSRENGVFEDQMAIEFLGSIWKLTLAAGKQMVSVRAVPVKPDHSRRESSAAEITLHGDMCEKIAAECSVGGIIIFPAPAASRTGYKLGTTVGALRDIFRKPRAARPAKAGVAEPAKALKAKSVPEVDEAGAAPSVPEVDEAGSDSNIEPAETDCEDGDSSEEEAMLRDLHDRNRDGPPVLIPAFERPAKRSRGSNDFEHEGRTMTRIWKNNKVTGAQELSGFSIICRCGHVDLADPDQACFEKTCTCMHVCMYVCMYEVCKKDLHMGSSLDEPTVLRRLLAWDAAGGKIAQDHPTGRHAHKFGTDARRLRTRTPSPPPS